MPKVNLRNLLLGCAALIGVVAVVAAYPASLLGGISEGLDDLRGRIDVPTGSLDIRQSVLDAINFVLSFLALTAVVVIIIAGFILILGLGSEASITRAKKIIIYTIIGLLVIFFASVIVSFITTELPGAF